LKKKEKKRTNLEEENERKRRGKKRKKKRSKEACARHSRTCIHGFYSFGVNSVFDPRIALFHFI